jgi:membrane-bound metal-dependent hydrolase YbcI (DUF457 family)
MDLFSHVVISYLLNVGLETPALHIVERPVIEFGVLMGILPDFDLLLTPLSGKVPLTKHRGVSHSLFFILVCALVSAWLASLYFLPSVKFTTLFIVALASGLMHLGTDFITTWGTPILWPISNREFKLDIDRALNLYLMFGSIGIIIFMNYLHTIACPRIPFLIACGSVAAIYIGYMSTKLILKLWLSRKYSHANGFKTSALPTAGLFTWFLISKHQTDKTLKLYYARYNLLKDHYPNFRAFECNRVNDIVQFPMDNPESAKSYSYELAEVQAYINKFKYPIASVKSGKTPGTWEVFWYPLELISLNRTLGIHVNIDPTGAYTVKKSYLKRLPEARW